MIVDKDPTSRRLPAAFNDELEYGDDDNTVDESISAPIRPAGSRTAPRRTVRYVEDEEPRSTPASPERRAVPVARGGGPRATGRRAGEQGDSAIEPDVTAARGRAGGRGRGGRGVGSGQAEQGEPETDEPYVTAGRGGAGGRGAGAGVGEGVWAEVRASQVSQVSQWMSQLEVGARAGAGVVQPLPVVQFGARARAKPP